VYDLLNERDCMGILKHPDIITATTAIIDRYVTGTLPVPYMNSLNRASRLFGIVRMSVHTVGSCTCTTSLFFRCISSGSKFFRCGAGSADWFPKYTVPTFVLSASV
jgi:hypothetical protein